MTHVCCRPCGLRFAPATPGYLTMCPECGLALEPVPSVRDLIGLRLFDPLDVAPAASDDVPAPLPRPTAGRPRR